jgi:hypothetical protein
MLTTSTAFGFLLNSLLLLPECVDPLCPESRIWKDYLGEMEAEVCIKGLRDDEKPILSILYHRTLPRFAEEILITRNRCPSCKKSKS